MDIIELLKELGIFGTAMYFIQLMMSKSADRKFEAYKDELGQKTREFQVKLDTKLELYKSELNLRNYKSTKTYEKQLDSILTLNKKLSNLNRDMIAMTAFMKTIVKDAEKEELERINIAANRYNDFIKYFDGHKIFYPPKTVEKIEQIRNDFFTSYLDYTLGHELGFKDKETAQKAGRLAVEYKNRYHQLWIN